MVVREGARWYAAGGLGWRGRGLIQFTHMLFPVQPLLFKRVEGRVFADLEFATVLRGAERGDLLVVFGVVVDGD